MMEIKQAAYLAGMEDAAKLAEAMPTVRMISAAHVKATSPDDVAATIRAEAAKVALTMDAKPVNRDGSTEEGGRR